LNVELSKQLTNLREHHINGLHKFNVNFPKMFLFELTIMVIGVPFGWPLETSFILS